MPMPVDPVETSHIGRLARTDAENAIGCSIFVQVLREARLYDHELTSPPACAGKSVRSFARRFSSLTERKDNCNAKAIGAGHAQLPPRQNPCSQPDHPACGRFRGAGRARQPFHDGHARTETSGCGRRCDASRHIPHSARHDVDGTGRLSAWNRGRQFRRRLRDGNHVQVGVSAGNKVAFWGSEAGALKAGNYPLDEFVYVLEGDLVTVDADGTRHEFHPGDALVIPKGWAGTWDMKTRFKKIIVNF